MKRNILLICSMLCLATFSTFAKGIDTMQAPHKLKKFYVASGMDGAIFSTATIKNTTPTGGTNSSSGTLRFSMFFNMGFTFNYNFNEHIGVYTGIDIKNIGYIEKASGLTVKHRVYNLGVPIGIKIGNMNPKKMYVFAGGGLDLPINYKEKTFKKRSDKTKFNEWFSQRTPTVMPYVFVGVALNHGMTIKAQYYPNNFMNPDFTKNSLKPYAGTEVHVIMLSLGFVVPSSFRHDMMKAHIEQLHAK